MRILLTGANGFIGKYLLATLQESGHCVVPAVRSPAVTDRLLAEPRSVRADLNRDVTPEAWLPRLKNIDVVINCAGILQGTATQSIEAIHTAAPIALFTACAQAGVRRVIQISAISATPGAGTAYAQTKQAADEFLKASDLDWIVVRPSLVYAQGAYGGTALFRALAVLPFVLPLPGKGDALFSPIHIDDLTAAIVKLAGDPSTVRVVIDPVGPERLRLREILTDLRQWLGASPAFPVHVPMPLLRLAAYLGDAFGGPVNSSALRQMEFGNDGPAEPFIAATGIHPRRWREMLRAHPAQTQDRWHAKLYFLRPALRLALALMWLISGASGLTHRHALIAALSAWTGNEGGAALVTATSLLDFLIAALVLTRRRTAIVCALQFAAVFAYTITVTILDPSLWLAPFGPLIKNLPVLAAIAVLGAIEADR